MSTISEAGAQREKKPSTGFEAARLHQRGEGRGFVRDNEREREEASNVTPCGCRSPVIDSLVRLVNPLSSQYFFFT